MKALGLVVSDKKIFENCILKTYFLTPWTTYATNWNGLNNFDRGPQRDHSCEVWSKSNKRFQRRCCLKKLLTHGRTHALTMDDGQWAITKAHLEHFVLRWAKNPFNRIRGIWTFGLHGPVSPAVWPVTWAGWPVSHQTSRGEPLGPAACTDPCNMAQRKLQYFNCYCTYCHNVLAVKAKVS